MRLTAHHQPLLQMANNMWNWELSHLLHPRGGVFFASTEHAPIPDVLVYSPEVENREWVSHEEWDKATKVRSHPPRVDTYSSAVLRNCYRP